MFKDVTEAIYFVEHIHKNGPRLNLNRMKRCLDLLKHPEKAYQLIHIAGTNGKGSTTCFLANIIYRHNYNVGMFISPYIISFHERIQVNFKFISDADLLEVINEVYKIYEIISNEQDTVSFFEYLTLMGLLYFKKQKVDYACIEVGLGGLLDATNAINYDLSLITSIGFDHMNQLGNTLESIALNKLGIIKPRNHLITTVSKNLKYLFETEVKNKSATMDYIDKENIIINENQFTFEGQTYKKILLGYYQAHNASLAIKAAKYILSNYNEELTKHAIYHTFWAGRLEKIDNKPDIILDGGHNISAIEHVVEAIKEFNYNKIYIIFMAMADKKYDLMISKLEEISNKFIFTTINYPRVCDPKILFEASNALYKSIALNPVDAIIEAKKNALENDCILCIGSLYLVTEIKAKYKNII